MAKKMAVDPRVYPSSGTDKLLGYANITLGGCFSVRGIRIVDSEKGPFVAMPSKTVSGEYRDIAFPVTADMRQELIDAVLSEYQRVMELPEDQRDYPQSPEPLDQNQTVKLNSRVILTPDNGKQLATVNLTLDGCFAINGLRVMDGGEKGPFVAMPTRFGGDGEFHDVAYPVTSAMREALDTQVLDRYSKALDKVKSIAERRVEKAFEALGQAEATQSLDKAADGSMTIHDLSHDQLVEVKGWLLTDRMMEQGESPSWDQLADADNLVTDKEVFDAYEGIVFTAADFFSEESGPAEPEHDAARAGQPDHTDERQSVEKSTSAQEKAPVADRIEYAKKEAQARQEAREQSGQMMENPTHDDPGQDI